MQGKGSGRLRIHAQALPPVRPLPEPAGAAGRRRAGAAVAQLGRGDECHRQPAQACSEQQRDRSPTAGGMKRAVPAATEVLPLRKRTPTPRPKPKARRRRLWDLIGATILGALLVCAALGLLLGPMLSRRSPEPSAAPYAGMRPEGEVLLGLLAAAGLAAVVLAAMRSRARRKRRQQTDTRGRRQ